MIGDIVKGLDSVIGRFKKSDDEKIREAALEMEPLLAQLRINEAEAKHANWFVAGWRPAVGWVCVLALLYQMVLWQIIVWVMTIWMPDKSIPPTLNSELLLTLLSGMLGIGGLRTFEKAKGVSTKQISK